MSEIILCCGKVCSGKTRFALFMEQSQGWFHFSADQWMRHFYGEIPDQNEFLKKLNTSKEMICKAAEVLLARQQKVVLDFGFWYRAERLLFKKRFEDLGFKVTIVYFPITYMEQLSHMANRIKEPYEGSYIFTDQEIRQFNEQFEEPAAKEVIEIDTFCRLNGIKYD